MLFCHSYHPHVSISCWNCVHLFLLAFIFFTNRIADGFSVLNSIFWKLSWNLKAWLSKWEVNKGWVMEARRPLRREIGERHYRHIQWKCGLVLLANRSRLNFAARITVSLQLIGFRLFLLNEHRVVKYTKKGIPVWCQISTDIAVMRSIRHTMTFCPCSCWPCTVGKLDSQSPVPKA